jgi:3-phytase
MMMKKFKSKAGAIHSAMFAVAGLLLSSQLSAAAPSAGAASNTASQLSALPALALKAHAYQHVQYEGQQLQLLVDKTGLQIRNQQGKTLASAAGHFSRFSTLQLPATTAAVSSKNAAPLLIAAVDDESQLLQLWSWQQQGLQLVQQQLITSRVVEDLCFYHSNDNQQLSLFLLGDRGGADQLLLQQQGRWLKQPLRIRELSVPYDSKACAVDQARGQLYLSEHSQAIWRYQAEPEADEGRQLLQVKQPFGVIAGEIVSLTVLPDGSLLALEEEPGRVLHLQWPQLASGELDQSVAAQVTTQPLGGEWAYLSAMTQPNQTQLFVSAKGEPVQVLQLTTATSHTRPALVSKKTAAVGEKSKLLPMQQVLPTVQTPAAPARGDVIDDPAIWHHAVTPAQSRILATDKRNGLEVYDLQGKLLQQLKVGRLNNVDVRYGLPFAGQPHDVAVASLRNNNSLQLFAINAQGEVKDAGQIATQLEEIYGLCLFQPAAGQVEVFVNDKSGLIEQFQLSSDGKRWQGHKVRQLQVPGQPEGCVVDDVRQQLYVGEEDVGIWRFAAAAKASSVGEKIILADGETLVADVEGLAFAPGERPYLLASSQGNDSYVLFSAVAPYQAVLRFRVITNPELAIDGTSETDGLDLTVRSLGPGFTEGALIIQDGRKRMPEQGQNLKYIPWSSVLELIEQR